MCRLCLMTFTDVPVDKKEMMHEILMRASHGDNGQKDGWGVTDMKAVHKSPSWYFEDVPTWRTDPDIDASGYLLGHLRKASGGTQRRVDDCHPYQFETPYGVLTAAHNGFFEGTRHTTWQAGMPSTDSYRALTELVSMLDGPIISPELITEWLSRYGDGSHYAIMLHLADSAYIMRGKTRYMAALPVGNGFIFHTESSVLHQMKRYIPAIFNVDVPDNVLNMQDNTYCRVALGSRDHELAELKPVHARTVYTAHTWPNDPKPQAAPVVILNGNESDVDDSGYTVAPSVTPPRPRKQPPLAAIVKAARDAADTGHALREKRSAWTTIAGKLSPLRKELSLYWATYSLGYTAEHESSTSYAEFLRRTSPTELRLLEGMFFPIIAGTTTWMKPFTPIAHLQINWWNHVVASGCDVVVHEELFGTRFFWLDVTYAAKKTEEGEFDTIGAMRVWVPYMMRLISASFTPGQQTRFFDLDKLQKIAAEDERVIML